MSVPVPTPRELTFPFITVLPDAVKLPDIILLLVIEPF
jgi:hypothetical protein